MWRLYAAGLACVLLLAAMAARAQQAEPDAPQPPGAAEEAGRYTFYRVQDGFVRLDIRSGQVSLCGRGAVGWTCQIVPDERAALEAELGRLQGENALLKKELLARGLPLPGAMRPPPEVAETAPKPPARPDAGPRRPGEGEAGRLRAFVERVWRRLVDMVADLQRDLLRKG